MTEVVQFDLSEPHLVSDPGEGRPIHHFAQRLFGISWERDLPPIARARMRALKTSVENGACNEADSHLLVLRRYAPAINKLKWVRKSQDEF